MTKIELKNNLIKFIKLYRKLDLTIDEVWVFFCGKANISNKKQMWKCINGNRPLIEDKETAALTADIIIETWNNGR
jgi:hypothetical protein